MISEKANPLVTVAIPCYKKSFLKEAILSVLRQSYNNIEVLVVDDASPDDLGSIVHAFSDPRIKYYRNERNLGRKNPAHNWNRCLELAQGDFFALLCDDDIYEPDFIDTMLSLAAKHPNCGTFRARANFINAEGKETNRYASAPEWESWEDYFWHVIRNYRSQTISEWMYRTETIRKAGGYALLPLAWYADYLSIFRIAQNGGIASTSKILMHFRQSGENISSRDDENTEKKIQAAIQYRAEVEKLLQGNPNKDYLLGGLDWLLRLHLKYNLKHAKRKALLNIYSKRKQYRIKGHWIWNAFWSKHNED